MNWILSSEVEMDRAVESLEFILDKQRHLDMLFLVEFENLLLDNSVIIIRKLVEEVHEFSFDLVQHLLCWTILVNHRLHHFQMLQSDVKDLLRVA